MNIARIKDMSEIQASIIKSMYKQVKDRCNDGKWRDFDADITVDGKRLHFSCKFKLDQMFLTFAHREMRDENNRVISPSKGLIIPPC